MNKNAKERKIVYACAFLIPGIVMLALLFVQKAIPFGKGTFLYADAYNQYYAFFLEMIRHVKKAGVGFVLWDRGMGVDFYANLLYYGMSPFNLLFFVFGEKHLELAMTLVILLKMSCMGLSACYFFLHTGRFKVEEEKSGLKNKTALVLSSAFVLSGYVLAYNHNLMWLDCLIMLPLLALAIEDLAEYGNIKKYTLFLCLTMVLNFYFAIYICVFCVLYFAVQDKGKKWIKRFLSFAGASVLSACMAGICLVPAMFAILNRGHFDDSFLMKQVPGIGNLWAFFESFHPILRYDALGDSIYTYNQYCGCVVVILVLLFFLNQSITRSRKIKYGAVLLCLFAAENIKGLNYVFHGFSYPHGMGNRFAFILVFFLVLISGEMLLCMQDMTKKEAFILGGGLLIYILPGMLIRQSASYMWMLIFGFVYAVFVVLYSRKSISKSVLQYGFLCVWMVELIGSGIYGPLQKCNGETFVEKIGYEQYREAYEGITTNPGERKTALRTASFMGNSETDWYSSILNGNQLETFQSLGLSNYEVAETTYRGLTPITALLYGVRYVLTDEMGLHGGYVPTYQAGDLTLYEAENPMGMGFVVDSAILDCRMDGNPFENQNSLFSKMCGMQKEQEFFTPAKLTCLQNKVVFAKDVKEKEQGFEYRSAYVFPVYFLQEYEAAADAELYMWVKDLRYRTVSVAVEEEQRIKSIYTDNASILCIGEVKKGQKVHVAIYSAAEMGQNSQMDYLFYGFDREAFLEALPKAERGKLQIESVKTDKQKGSIEAREDGILYLALPYQRGFRVSVDGVRMPVHKIGPGLMGVDITKGKHEVEIAYATFGFLPGVILSLVGFLIFAVLCLAKGKKIVSGKENKES